MGRIRLQICVLPWEQPAPLPSNSSLTRQETVKWCEPCTEDTHMQEVCDRIFVSWERIFEPSMGPLNIRYLKTTYGEFVDLQERVVGDLFDDRGADGFMSNSILEVHRYPPSPDELQTLQRFSSLAPTSSVRPKKRPLEIPLQSYPSQASRDTDRAMPSIEEGDTETERPFGTAVKRRRTDDPRLNNRIAADQSLGMSKEHGGGPHHSSQTSGTQEPVHQVPDSQRSSRKKHRNPYGTPTSLALIGSQESLPANEIDLSAIPDSPLGREAISGNRALDGVIHLDRGSPKEESPELRASVQEIPPTDDTSGKQPTASATSPKPSTPPFIFNSASQPPPIPPSIPELIDGYVKKHDLGVGQTGQNTSDVNGNHNRISLIADPARAQTARSSCKSTHDSDPIFDPIESDTESFNEKQQMQHAKRLRSSRKSTASSASSCASKQAEAGRRDGQFLVPSIPQPGMNGACMPSGEANAPGQRENIRKSSEDLKAASMNAQDDVQQQGKHDANVPGYQQSESCNTEPNKMSRKTPLRSKGGDNLTSTAKTSSQPATDWSQDSVESFDRTGKAVNQKLDGHMSSQEWKTSEKLAREEQTKERALAEEANKLTLAEEGAKLIQAEKREKEKAKRRGTTPSSIDPKRSMTPLVPETTATKCSSHQPSLGSSLSSNPTSGSTGKMNAPLRSALRQTPSALRRSVSSVSFDVLPRAKPNEDIPSTTVSKARSKTPIQIPLPKTSQGKPTKAPAKNGKVQTKLKVAIQPKKLKGRVVDLPIKPTPAPKQEIVLSSGEDSSTSEESKWPRGNAKAGPSSRKSMFPVTTFQGKSSTSEEPKWQSGNAKAGPRSRKPMFPITTFQGKKTTEVPHPSAHIDPNIRNIKVEEARTAAQAIISRSTPRSDTTSLQNSNSRSPAQAFSESIPLSTSSASNSDSGSASGDSDSGSISEEELLAPSSKSPTGVTNGGGRVATGAIKGMSKAVNLGTKQLQGNIQSKRPSQLSRSSSSGSRDTVSVQGDDKHVDQVADTKSQLKSGKSVSLSRVRQAPSTTSSVANDKVINQGLDHARRAPNPRFFRYPTLTDQVRLQGSLTTPISEKPSSQPLGTSPLDDSGSDDSSSEDDDSSSTSDGEQEPKRVASLTGPKKSISDYPGGKGLLKLANRGASKVANKVSSFLR